MSALGLGLIAAGSYYDENKRLAEQRRQDQQMELQEKRFGLEQVRADREGKRFEREEKQWSEQDAFKDEQKQWYGQTRRAQIEQESKNALAQWEQENNAYQARAKAGQSPETIGAAPVKPILPAMTQLDALQDMAGYLDLQARHGKYDPQAWMQLGKAMQDVQQEGTLTALRKLQAGDKDGAIQAFNASGNTRITAADVLEYRPVKTKIGGAEVDTYEITYKRPDGSVVRMNAAQQLDALDKADKLVSRHYLETKDRREDRETGAKVTSANASLRNANANAALHNTQQQAAQLQLEQARLGVAARRKQAAGQELTPDEKAALASTAKEARNEYAPVVNPLDGSITVFNKDTGVGVRHDRNGQYAGQISANPQAPQTAGGAGEKWPQPVSGGKPPVQGARQAADGKWYVQQDGKWFMVN